MKVGLVLGSDSDIPVMKKAFDLFNDFGVECEVLLASAHRTPAEVREFASTAQDRGLSCIIAGAGMAAHLPGVIASYTTLPVIGVPLESGSLKGMDALLAIVQMPSGTARGHHGYQRGKERGALCHPDRRRQRSRTGSEI